MALLALRDRNAVRSQLDFTRSPSLIQDTQGQGPLRIALALKPEDHGKSTVLEIAVGGKLYKSNAVTEDERMNKDLAHGGI